MHHKIHPICQTWLDAANQARLEDMLVLYAPGAVLLPTFSKNFLEKNGDTTLVLQFYRKAARILIRFQFLRPTI